MRGLVKLQWWKKYFSGLQFCREEGECFLSSTGVSKNWMNGTFQINGTKEKAEAGKCF